MKYLFAALLLAAGFAEAVPVVPVCPATVGTLALHVSRPRSSCISPCLIFFDATTTTDTSIVGNTTVFQDVTFSWNFGDTLASGRGTWAYGSNPGGNSMNAATGAIAAHLFRTQGRDTKFTIVLTAKDLAGNTAVCGSGITAFDPNGANGFPGSLTTCVSASGTPVAGVGGCPTGAAVLHQANFNTALTGFGNSKRYLFKCGDTFTGDYINLTAAKGSIGAYGGCEGTTTNRPIFSDTGSTGLIAVTVGSSDVRVADLDLQGSGSGICLSVPAGTNTVPWGITWYNINCNNVTANYYVPQANQFGLINSTSHNMTSIGSFFNLGGGNPTLWTGPFPNDNYQAYMGNLFDGTGVGTSGGVELVRVAYSRLSVYENNTFVNANINAALLKFHAANGASNATWDGIYNELNMITDNYFHGQSGSIQVEIAPQNSSFDERIKNLVYERNVDSLPDNIGMSLIVSAQNVTVRDNAMSIAAGYSSPPYYCIQVGARGNFPAWQSQFNEFYNNTCVSLSNAGGASMIAFQGGTANPLTLAGINNVMQNNSYYNTTAGKTTFVNSGTGNTISNNTATPTNSPGFTNGSGTLSVISDFKPTANYTGGTSVPVVFDALGVLWFPTWDLGAVHH
jgi:hypothetical protein